MVNDNMLKFVDKSSDIAELRASNFDSQTHERHLAFKA